MDGRGASLDSMYSFASAPLHHEGDTSQRDGIVPKDRKSLGRLISEFSAERRNIIPSRRQIDIREVYANFNAPVYLPCVAEMAVLEKIFIKDLRLHTYHRGKYIVLRAATPAIHTTWITVVVKDELGEGAVLRLFNQEQNRERCK